jgi:hypothetical protein
MLVYGGFATDSIRNPLEWRTNIICRSHSGTWDEVELAKMHPGLLQIAPCSIVQRYQAFWVQIILTGKSTGPEGRIS